MTPTAAIYTEDSLATTVAVGGETAQWECWRCGGGTSNTTRVREEHGFATTGVQAEDGEEATDTVRGAHRRSPGLPLDLTLLSPPSIVESTVVGEDSSMTAIRENSSNLDAKAALIRGTAPSTSWQAEMGSPVGERQSLVETLGAPATLAGMVGSQEAKLASSRAVADAFGGSAFSSSTAGGLRGVRCHGGGRVGGAVARRKSAFQRGGRRKGSGKKRWRRATSAGASETATNRRRLLTPEDEVGTARRCCMVSYS